MTFLQVVNIIRDTALAQPNVNSVVREFLDLNREDAKYSAVVIQDRDGSRDRIVEQDYITYTWHLGYVDRLTYDESNRDDIISTGINIINNIVNTIRNTWFPELEVSIVDRINTFDQRFTAQCAGVYVVLAVNAQVSDCIDSESTDLYDTYDAKITANGVYHFVPSGRPVDEINITVDVESSKPEESLIETITSNGSYSYTPEEGSVFSDVSIAVDVHPTERLVETITSNGSYNYPGEYSGVDISVDCPVPKTEERGNLTISSNGSGVLIPSSGNVFDGVDYVVDVHPTERLVKTITSNSITDLSGEWKDASITVDVHPSDKLIKTYTENGIYNVSGEWKDAAITVAIPVKTETSLTKSISSNGSYHYEPEDGSVFNMADITVDVHPSVSLSKTYTSNGSYNISGEFNGGTVTVAVSGGGEKPEESLVEAISSNGSYHYDPTPGSVFSSADITVDVHPSSSLSKTYTTNGKKTITGEFNGGSITINVHPTAKLSKTYTKNGTYNVSGEWKNASITVNVPSTTTVTMTQAEYDALTVKGSKYNIFDKWLVMWNADKIVYRNDDSFVRAYQGSELVWEKIPNNTIYYTTTDNQIINIPSGYYWGDGVEIISNTYNDVGVIIFSGDVDTISSSSSGPFRGNTRILTITLPRSIDYIQSYAFAGCSSLKEIEIPGKVGGNLGSYCFYQCTSLVKVKINKGITVLPSSSFRGCTSLISIEIPDTIGSMRDACFYGCTSLVEVIMYPTTPPKTVSNNNFNNNAPGRLIKVPSGSVNAYKTASGWSTYADSIVSQ